MIADFSFSADQLELQRSARRLFAERSSLTAVRQTETSDTGYQPDLWRKMAELGWLGMALPHDYGGGGGRYLDLYALCEEMGRALVASPFLDTVAVGAELVARAGTAAQRQTVLPAVARGDCVIAALVADGNGDACRSGVTAAKAGVGWRLEGACPLVAYASSADYLCCAVAMEAADGSTVLLVPASAPGLSVQRLRTIGGVPLSQVTFEGVRVAIETVVGQVGSGGPVLSAVVRRAAVLQTAIIVGAAHAVLAMTNQYAKDRVQFGVPIGKHQAVQYMVSDVLIDLHTADLLGRQAAYRIDVGLADEWAAEVAIVHGKETTAHLHRQAHEVHAGIGFMVEHPLQLFSRRSKYWENNLGGLRYHYERVAQLLCGT